jgi:hypothetical protein
LSTEIFLISVGILVLLVQKTMSLCATWTENGTETQIAKLHWKKEGWQSSSICRTPAYQTWGPLLPKKIRKGIKSKRKWWLCQVAWKPWFLCLSPIYKLQGARSLDSS